MVGESVTALCVGKDKTSAFQFLERLAPEVICSSPEFSTSLSDAFQLHIESEYRFCFIFEGFEKEYPTFFSDIRALGRLKTCSFVRVTRVMTFGGLDEKFRALGFSTEISAAASDGEKRLIEALFVAERRIKEVEQRCDDVSKAVSVLLREIDGTAKQRKRGRYRQVDTNLKGYLQNHTNFDPTILERFIDALTDKSEKSPPFKPVVMEVPEEWLKRLPEMTRDGYKGVSNRTWDRLRKRWGKSQV